MGVLVLLPFLVVDIAVATTLMAMGMMMVPPATISLPLKLMLFVLADGWNLVVGSIIASFR
jgi:flagellar biosynthetic protein FliP